MGQDTDHQREAADGHPGRGTRPPRAPSGPTVLLFTGDEGSAEPIMAALAEDGCQAHLAAGGSPDELLAFFAPALVLVDGGAAHATGVDLLRALRRSSDVPVIVISPTNAELDIVLALELGADDVISRPLRPRELTARIRAVLRRTPAPAATEATPSSSLLRGGDVVVDVERHEVTLHGAPVHLPLREFEVLALLLEHRNRVLTRDTMFRRIWGPNFSGDPKTLDVHIKRLREKLEPDPANPTRIVTIRGVGYRFVVPD